VLCLLADDALWSASADHTIRAWTTRWRDLLQPSTPRHTQQQQQQTAAAASRLTASAYLRKVSSVLSPRAGSEQQN